MRIGRLFRKPEPVVQSDLDHFTIMLQRARVSTTATQGCHGPALLCEKIEGAENVHFVFDRLGAICGIRIVKPEPAPVKRRRRRRG